MVQAPTDALAAINAPHRCRRLGSGGVQLVTEPLLVPLLVMVTHVLANSATKMCFTGRDDAGDFGDCLSSGRLTVDLRRK